VKSALLALLLFSAQADARQVTAIEFCYILRANIEKVEAWTNETKDRIYWECKSRAQDLRMMGELTAEESLRLRESWALVPRPERDE
jgi:hypothetical protein